MVRRHAMFRDHCQGGLALLRGDADGTRGACGRGSGRQYAKRGECGGCAASPERHGSAEEGDFLQSLRRGALPGKPTGDAQVAITTDEAKRIVISMLRNVSREMFVRAVEMGVMRNSGPQMPSLRARLDRLERALPALKKGEVLDMTYLPGAGTLVRGGDQTMTTPGKDFSDALFSVWLGPKPINSALKRQLLGG